ncbi:DUF3231 family protein [Paenibacillus nanensis]|uniref:DUF3231 family protein n=1 Tax=Paenibacillus nanensis TaxID=393251 RepID=A0A3A1UXK9_9BACL|nr:DUF3231 family protein [Paenibacillus nanensis]RIX50060.1 DUF3231 family protein [Paenibacillus nanensis]
MSITVKLSASELGALWMTYHKKTMILRILEYFMEKSDDNKAKSLMSGLHESLHQKVVEIKKMFENEGAAVPVGFTEEDLHLEAPKLWDNGFDIMFCRVLKEISMGMYVLHMTISYREDMIKLYKQLTDLTQTYYNHFTQYLLEKNLLPRPNFTNMPQSADYIHNKDYMKGTNLFGHKRSINTVEFGILYHIIETNITGMQLMKGFAQCSKDEDAQKYFQKGHKLAKDILKEAGEILQENTIQPSATPGGTVTNATAAPFSDKLMMFCTYLLGGFSIGSSGFSAAFNLRNDVAAQSAVFAKDIYAYTIEGAKLMIAKGWFEEPPKMDI